MKTIYKIVAGSGFKGGTFDGKAHIDTKSKEWKEARKKQVGFKGRPLTHELDNHAKRYGKVVKHIDYKKDGSTFRDYQYEDGGIKSYMKDHLGSWHHYNKVK